MIVHKTKSKIRHKTKEPFKSYTKSFLVKWLKRYQKIKTVCSFDVETTSLDWREGEIFSYCIGHMDGHVEVHRLDTSPRHKAKGMKRLKEFFADPTIAKIAHNHKFELQYLQRHNIYIHPHTVWHDTMLMSRTLRNLAPSHQLDYLCWELARYEIETPFGTFNSRQIDKKVKEQAEARGGRYDKVDKHLMHYYQIADGERPCLLFYVWEPKFKEDINLYIDYISEVLTMQTTERFEKTGIALDWDNSNSMLEWLEKELEDAQDDTFDYLGEYVNLLSEPQLVRLLYSRFSLPVLRKTKKNNSATDKTVLLDLRRQYKNPIFDLILKCRSYTNAKAMLTSYQELANEDGIIYPTINSCQAKTHRQSGQNPNLQNVGKGLYDEEANPFPVQMRTCFKAPKGHFLVLGDYAGIEMRLIVELAESIKMIKAMNSGISMHELACKLFYQDRYINKKETKSLYSWGKNGHFLLGYGGQAKKLRTTLKFETLKEAREAIERYRAEFPEIVDLNHNVGKIIKKQGYIHTKFGNRLYVAKAKAFSGLNYLIQCTAAKILKRAEICVEEYLKTVWNNQVKIVVPIHDELILQFPNHLRNKVNIILSDISRIMCDIPEVEVPMEVEWKLTKGSWADAKDIEIPKKVYGFNKRMEQWLKAA